MSASIASLRKKDVAGGVALSDVPLTAAGYVLGVALLADSSPPGSHTHRQGRRFVTASLSIHHCPDTLLEPPTHGRVAGVMGSWPTMLSEARVYAASGALRAASHATFMGFTAEGGRGAHDDGDATAPRIDAAATGLAGALTSTWRWHGPAAGRSRMPVTAELRNRFGPMHGAVAHAALSLLALGLARREEEGPLEPPDGRECILDGRARFLRPISDDEVDVAAAVVRRSRRLVDVDCTITSLAGDMLAIGQFTVLRGE